MVSKLSSLQLHLTSIQIPLKGLPKIHELPLYRLQLFLDGEYLDENEDIIAAVDRMEKCIKLTIYQASFKYQSLELFGKYKVVRVNVKVIRFGMFGQDQEMLQEFWIVLSKYGLQYNQTKDVTTHGSTIGTKRHSFLYYDLSCTFQKQKNPVQTQKSSLSIVPQLHSNLFQTFSSQSHKTLPILTFQTRELPIHSNQSHEKRPVMLKSQTYFSQDTLHPVYYQDEAEGYVPMKINLTRNITEDQPQQEEGSLVSMRQEMQSIRKAMTRIEKIVFLVFMIIGVVSIVSLMGPELRV